MSPPTVDQYQAWVNQRWIEFEQCLIPLLAAMVRDPVPPDAASLDFEFLSDYGQMVAEVMVPSPGKRKSGAGKPAKNRPQAACVIHLNWLQLVSRHPGFNFADFLKSFPTGYEHHNTLFLEQLPEWWVRSGGNSYPLSVNLKSGRRVQQLASQRAPAPETQPRWHAGPAAATAVPRPSGLPSTSPTPFPLHSNHHRGCMPGHLGHGLFTSGHLWCLPTLYSTAIAWQEGDGARAEICFAPWPQYNTPMIFTRHLPDGSSEKLLAYYDDIDQKFLKDAVEVQVIRRPLGG